MTSISIPMPNALHVPRDPSPAPQGGRGMASVRWNTIGGQWAAEAGFSGAAP
jgi:hypothetical protein